MEKMRRITISLGDDHWAKLRDLRGRSGISFSEAIRRGISCLPSGHEPQSEPIACASGPGGAVEPSGEGHLDADPDHARPLPAWEDPDGHVPPQVAALINLMRGHKPDLVIPEIFAQYAEHNITAEVARVAVVEALRFLQGPPTIR